MANFKIKSDFKPQGDQPKAIKLLAEGLKAGKQYQTLYGVTKRINLSQWPTSMKSINGRHIISHNKTSRRSVFEEFDNYSPERG
jgi:excinuclease ABC subunit B